MKMSSMGNRNGNGNGNCDMGMRKNGNQKPIPIIADLGPNSQTMLGQS